jgi:hypothetical protein
MKVKEQEMPRNPIKVLVLDAAHRPPRPPSAPTLDLQVMPKPDQP